MLDVFVGRGCPQYVYGVSANTFLLTKRGKRAQAMPAVSKIRLFKESNLDFIFPSGVSKMETFCLMSICLHACAKWLHFCASRGSYFAAGPVDRCSKKRCTAGAITV